jgi:hypothetical protein
MQRFSESMTETGTSSETKVQASIAQLVTSQKKSQCQNAQGDAEA